VSWVDTVEDSAGWKESKGYKLPPRQCQSVGWVHQYNSDYITLAATKCDDSDIGRVESIPRAWAVSIKEVLEDV
jgi:hypothetical protein